MHTSARASRVCLLTAAIGFLGPAAAGAATFDLADALGGGNGFGTGTPGSGYDQHSGAPISDVLSQDNTIPGDNNVYHVVNPNPYVDGIFVPDGDVGAGQVAVQVTSTGITSTAVPNTGGQSWENGKGYNDACCGTNLTVGGNPVNFGAGGNTFISFHPNVGLTFDLDAVRTANPGQTISNFTAIVGGTDPNGTAAFTALLDGVVAQPTINFTGTSEAASVNVPVLATQRFLTLLGTDQDQTYANDGFIIGNPRLELVPEPGSLSLVGLAGLLALRRRAR